MAIINKDRYLKDIAAAVRRGALYFESQDRPALEMGGRQVFISSVSYDMDSGTLSYAVSNARGDVLPSAHGVRPLSNLDARSLLEVSKTVGRYAALRQRRDENLIQLASRSVALNRRNIPKL